MLYGRDAERAQIGALLDGARDSRGGVLVLRGEPGAGKTALLADARERAAGMQVLTARGVESESELAFAGLHQLLRPALHLVESLPPPQAAALGAALGLTEAAGGDNRFLIAAASLTLLSAYADGGPVLCLVDDAQWLDGASTDALLFVARRLEADGIVLLFGARETGERRFEAPGLPYHVLGNLKADDAAALLTQRAGGALTASVRDLLVAQAGGNPLALVELPGALTPEQLAGAQPMPRTLPLSRDVERLFLERVRRLPEQAQRLLELLAVDEGGVLAPLMRAAGDLGSGEDALTAAEQAGLVSVRGEHVDLRHPLVRSAVLGGASSSKLRAAHLALADALTGDLEADQRTWHRAAAALGPDAIVAGELEDVAARARSRGGHAAATAALERAAALSVDAGSMARRLVDAASEAWHAGEPERASALVDRAAPLVADPPMQAELDHIRGVIEWRCGALPEACATLLQGAADVASSSPRKALEMLFDAGLVAVDLGDFVRVAEAGERAAALPRSDDPQQRYLVELIVGVGSLTAARSPHDRPLVLETLSRARELDQPRWLVWAAAGAAAAGDEETELALLRRAVALARASGAVDALTVTLETVAVSGVLAGRFAVDAEATEGLQLAREAGLPNAAAFHLGVLSVIAAVRGRDDECARRAGEALAAGRPAGSAFASSLAEWALALLDLGRGRPEDAMARLSALRDAGPGRAQPYVVLSALPDLAEACVRAGRREEAGEAYALLGRFARPGAPAWAIALGARCRGLLAEGAEAESEFADALRLHAAAHRPFDQARTELLLGEHLRRQRRRIEARAHLRAALDAFEGIGAAPWTDRARTELRASGESARRRDPATVSQLTPQELQVARLVAQGLPTKEVAAQLFLSPRTIDAHLRNVFAKLSITSRRDLTPRELGADGLASPPAAALTIA